MIIPDTRLRPRRIAGAVGLVLLAAASGGRTAHAEALERNLPPQTRPPEAVTPPPNIAPNEQDSTPIGPAVRAVVLLGPSEPPRAGPASGIETGSAFRLRPARMRASLKGFLGRPLSRRLIAQVEAAVALDYRRAGYPFVSVSTPAQELTGGVLQIRVIEFSLGQLTVKGATRTPQAYIAGHVRARAGGPIDSDDLSEDLDALNRYPFRRIDAVFTPGASLGQTDLILNAVETKPWSVYAGYSNSGSPSTGWDRYFAGARVGGLLGRDSLLSDQFTASGDALFDKERLFSGVAYPHYLSDAVSLVVPTNPRGQIEAVFDWIQTNQISAPFTVRQTTFEASLGYRFALSNLGGATSGWGEARFGVEARRQEILTLFTGAGQASDLSVEVYQLYFGYAKSAYDALGRTDLDLVAHLSPGVLDAAAGKAQALLFSKGRVSDVRYAYLGLTLSRTTKLPFGLAWSSQLIGQYSPRPLEGTEQMGIGGQGLVRGYNLEDGAFDQAIVLRDELHGPALAWPKMAPVQLAPYAFVDAGSGRDDHTGYVASAASVGLGGEFQIGGRLALSLDGAYALTRAVQTRPGDWRLETRASLAF
jgi:hemolysin activation/secretion protein